VKFASEAPGYPSGYTYDALHLYKLAVEAAKSDDPDKLVPVLEKIDYTGVACRYVFTDTHNTRFGEGYRIFPMVQWREDGSRVVVWPASLATGEFLTPPWLKK
jgi:branched-chain amino acid transport system substrate-binding protein